MRSVRKSLLTRPIFGWAQKAMPGISETERAALDAGDVWWDGDLFSGNPDWQRLLEVPAASLTEDERAFIDGPVDELCAMLDDWRINWELRDLPKDAWEFMKKNKFFGMIIPKEFGGLGFSAYAHSQVVRRLSTRCLTGAVTVMVPNSLGPGELLLLFGTREQQHYWLPRLADGREIPSFALTSPEAGSDAASMTDTGIVCRGRYDGGEVLGIRLNWNKRYITLAPVATVMGLAFKLHDPDGLIGEEEDLGITVALVPTHLPGVKTGRRHLPSMQMFQNGPTQGEDVFIPLDHVIGGPEKVGQGWAMLMTALSAGRGISLPSLAAAGASFAAHTTGAYARIREQFGIPISKFEGIQQPLARLAGNAYLVEAARRFTCAGIDQGVKPAVVSGIMKLHATERLRGVVNDAMDVHAGKAVVDGPLNYMGSFYRAMPIGITVEGANILTRSLIVFGQGAIRSHPHLLDEILALADADADAEAALDAFDKAFWAHAGHSTRTLFRAWWRAWTGGRLAPAPEAGPLKPYYRQLGRYAAAFALTADMALLTLGGALKRREMLSARLGDILSELFLLSAVLKRWHEEGHQEDDLPVVEWCMETGFATIETRFSEVLANLPNRVVAGLLRFLIMPRGIRRRGPSDEQTVACAELLAAPSPTRERIASRVFPGQGDDALARIEHAFELVIACAPIRARMRQAGVRDREAALNQGLIDQAEADRLKAEEAAIAKAVAVDDFAPEELAPLTDAETAGQGERPSPARRKPARRKQRQAAAG